MIINKTRLNEYCLQRVRDYQNLDIWGKSVCTPYFINSVEQKFTSLMKDCNISEIKIREFHKRYKERQIKYGWYMGKGSPEEIEKAVKSLLPFLKGSNVNVIIEMMKLYGLGIDCSGFVYQVLNYAFAKHNMQREFNESLAWKVKQKQCPTRAGVFIFRGNASKVVLPSEVRPLDIICVSHPTYQHIALVVETGKRLKIAQSSIGVTPTGINVSSFSINNNLPKFTYEPVPEHWENLYVKGSLKFRRLKILYKRT